MRRNCFRDCARVDLGVMVKHQWVWMGLVPLCAKKKGIKTFNRIQRSWNSVKFVFVVFTTTCGLQYFYVLCPPFCAAVGMELLLRLVFGDPSW